MRFRHLLAGLAVAVAVVLASPPSAGTAAPGDISGVLPRGGGIGLVVWGGGTVDGLRAAAAGSGCTFTAAWVSSPSGEFIGYVSGAPAVVNAAFTAAYPTGLPPVTPLLVLCRSSPPPQAPVPTAVGTSVLSPTGRLAQLQVAEPAPGIPRYDRAGWPLWIDEDHDCQDARQEVLIAESWAQVTFETPASCRVSSGEWHDPYTGTVLTDPSGLDIDHLVPLENAYVSGGWRWDLNRRRSYANDLAHPEHLVAVTASANRSKGSQGPEDWRPPRAEFWCEYATSWVTVKVRWELTATVRERDALAAMLATCPPSGSSGAASGIGAPASIAPSTGPNAVPTAVPPSVPTAAGQFANCDAVRAAGAAPLRRGDPGYRAALDRDGDGIACE